MDRGLATLIGMSIAYLASFLGMGFAYLGWRRRRRGGPAASSAHPGGRTRPPAEVARPPHPGADR
ncbi:MAG: hypothetical protein ACE5HQ_03275 [Gemmatimonadota bacterium]